MGPARWPREPGGCGTAQSGGSSTCSQPARVTRESGGCGGAVSTMEAARRIFQGDGGAPVADPTAPY